MLLEVTNNKVALEEARVKPEDHLLGIVQRIVASKENTRILLSGKGEITIFPESQEYCANVQDMLDFCRTPAEMFEVSGIGKTALPSSDTARNIRELLWQAAFHISEECMVAGCSKYDVVQFRYWPNLTRLPVTPHTARICALLTRHPTTIMLVHRMLGIDKTEVGQIFSAAYSAGIADTLSRACFEAGATDIQPEPVKEHGLFRSLFAKISRL